MPKIHRSNGLHESHSPNGLAGFDQESIVKLHEYTAPEFLGLSKFSSKKKEVNASTMQNLKLAEDAVLKVKYLLPYGAGNQKLTSVTPKESHGQGGRCCETMSITRIPFRMRVGL